MRFLVGDRLPDVVADAFDEPPEQTSSLDEIVDLLGARERGDGSGAAAPPTGAAEGSVEPDETDVLLVHAPSYDGDIDHLVDTVRSQPGGDTIPIVLLVEDTSRARTLLVDGVVALPADARTVRQTADRAAMLEAYRDAVSQFYDACQAWSGDEFDHALLERRYEADQLFSDLSPIDEDVPLSSILRERSDREP